MATINVNSLTAWIDQQKSFGKHKKKLNKIYSNLDSKSKHEFGMNNSNQKYTIMLNNNITLTNQFKETQKHLTVDKDNKLLFRKIVSIQKRDNKFMNHVYEHSNKSQGLRNRSHKLKVGEFDGINKMNSTIGNRIMLKSSSLSFKRMDEDYSKKQYYMNFSRKFLLPDMKKKGRALAHVETVGFMRKTFSGFFDPNHIIDANNHYNEELFRAKVTVNSLQKSVQKIPECIKDRDANLNKFKSKISYNNCIRMNKKLFLTEKC